MKLSIDYLNQRHEYWIHRIGETGIWNPLCFQPVNIILRKNSRSYHGMFQRRIKTCLGKKNITDKIIIYNKAEDFDHHFIDSVLVHEMIHQYIFQNNLKDNRSHGPLFRGFMKRINDTFPGELKINIRDRNPVIPVKGPGTTVHKLLLLEYTDGNYFLAVIHPSRLDFMEGLVKRNMKLWKFKSYHWAESNDVYFSRYRRCMRSLHGIRKSSEDLAAFCNEYNIKFQLN